MPYATVEKRKKAQLSRYQRRIKRAKEYLGGECIDCGENALPMLEFDHQDPQEKEFNITRRWGLAWEKLVEELDKCVLRCQYCHAKKTVANGENIPPVPKAKAQLYHRLKREA